MLFQEAACRESYSAVLTPHGFLYLEPGHRKDKELVHVTSFPLHLLKLCLPYFSVSQSKENVAFFKDL